MGPRPVTSYPWKVRPLAQAASLRRLVSRASPGAWLGLCVRVVEPFSRGGAAHPAHWLAAGWAPGEPRSRWPEAVVIGSPAAADALALLLARMPPDAGLFLADRDAVDAALAARILLAADRNLEPYQRAGIEAFAADEDARVAARVAGSYTDRDEDFERFRARLLADARR